MLNPAVPKTAGHDSAGTIEGLSASTRQRASNSIPAVAANADSGNQAHLIRDELARMNERVQKAENDLLEKSRELSRQSSVAAAQIAALREGLAAAIAAIPAPQPHLKLRGVFLCAAISVIAVAAFFLPRLGVPVAWIATEARKSSHTPWQQAARLRIHAATSLPPLAPLSFEEQALDRLNLALGRVPGPAVDNVLTIVNSALVEDGDPPCTVRFPTGERSLLVVVKRGGGSTPLADALLRCAGAVEQVLD